MRKSFFLLVLFLVTVFFAETKAQSPGIRALLDTLASPYMGGRGYVDSGLQRSAHFIEGYFRQLQLLPVKGSYRQAFEHAVNIFPGEIRLKVGKNVLKPGSDFLVEAGSRAAKGKGRLEPMDSIRWIDYTNKVIIEAVAKLTWSVSPVQQDYTHFQVLKSKLPRSVNAYEACVDAKLVPSFRSENLMAMVAGTEVPDSFLVITAHYDHLGKMGADAVFRGANDNASGVALMLDLCSQISQHPLRYSVLFIAFAGEEAGLMGSHYFVQHPIVPLNKMAFLVNIDLMGTGDDGMMAVNATEFPKEWSLLDSLNTRYGLLKQIGQRGKARNSDHYWFTEAGVPSFFFYTMGGIAAYHDILDLPETLPLTKTKEAGQLIRYFFHTLSNSALPEKTLQAFPYPKAVRMRITGK